MDNEFATALVSGDYDPDLLRAGLVGRVIYTLSDSEDPANLTANVDGRVPLAIAWHGIVFWLDPDDTVSDPDGIAVIRTNDDYVYKVEDPDYRIRAVLSDTVAAPPALPSIGDAYLVPAGATGAWSSHQDDIAIFTRNGWRFEIPVIGKWLLVEDADGFKRYTSGGWMYGPGARSFDDDSIPLAAALGWGERIIVENQSTNTPPTATKGLRYVVGSAPTGAWIGKAKQVAICEVAGTWSFYPPSNGWEIYDKAQAVIFTFNGTSWVSSAGTWIGFQSVSTAGGSIGLPAGVNGYNYVANNPPTVSNRRYVDAVFLTRAARVGTQRLRITYSADLRVSDALTASANGATGGIALFRDSEAAAIDFCLLPSENTNQHVDLTFIVDVADTNPHNYGIATLSTGISGTKFIDYAPSRRTLTIEERA